MPALLSDLFTLEDLCAAVNKVPDLPTLTSRWFESDSSRTTAVAIDVEQARLQLVASSPRGTGNPSIPGGSTRKTHVISVSHLEQWGTIKPEDVQDVRSFGSTEPETIAARVSRVQTALRRNIEATMEWQRVGAIKGVVLDADGSTTLHDIYATFGVTQPSEVTINVPSAASGKTNSFLDAIMGVHDAVEDAMGAAPVEGIAAICGADFWAALIGNPFTREAYNLWAAQSVPTFGEVTNAYRPFRYAGIDFYRYNKSVGGSLLVASNKAHVFPVGSGIFKTIYGPADYVETANTDGIPYYSKIEALPYGKGYGINVQSNPLMLCMYPEALRTIKAVV